MAFKSSDEYMILPEQKNKFCVVLRTVLRGSAPSLRGREAQVLLEVLIAVAVLAGIAIVIAVAITTSLRAQGDAKLRGTAAALAAEGMEAVRQIAYSDDAQSQGWNRVYCPPDGACPDPSVEFPVITGKGFGVHYQVVFATGSWNMIAGEETISKDQREYTRFLIIENVCRENGVGTGNIKGVWAAGQNCATLFPGPPAAYDDPWTQRVMVIVKSQGISDIVVSEYLTRFRNVASTQSKWTNPVPSPVPVVQAFGNDYHESSGNLALSSIALQSSQVSGWLTSHVFDTRAVNGALLNSIMCQGLSGVAAVIFSPTGPFYHPSPAQSDFCGSSASVSAADVNGDGRADVVMGCKFDDNTVVSQGSAVVFLRNAGNTGFETGQVLYHPSPAQSDECGSSVSAADVNGDGRADVVMGCKFDDNTVVDQGSAVVFLRNAGNTGFETGQVLYHPSPAQSDECGSSVSAADVNGDGRADVVMDCKSDDNTVVGQGSAVVFLRTAGNPGFETGQVLYHPSPAS